MWNRTQNYIYKRYLQKPLSQILKTTERVQFAKVDQRNKAVSQPKGTR